MFAEAIVGSGSRADPSQSLRQSVELVELIGGQKRALEVQNEMGLCRSFEGNGRE